MNCAMKCAWLFLSSLLILEVNGLAFDDLDFARSTIKSVAKSITSKPVSINDNRLFKSAPKIALRDNYMSTSDPKTLQIMATINKIRTTKPARNLNKFNEAMDQVERAMAQAELSRKTAKLPDLRNDITNAVNRGNVR